MKSQLLCMIVLFGLTASAFGEDRPVEFIVEGYGYGKTCPRAYCDESAEEQAEENAWVKAQNICGNRNAARVTAWGWHYGYPTIATASFICSL